MNLVRKINIDLIVPHPIIYINSMSSNELLSRKSQYSNKQYENSSICNRSIKTELNNLSIDLPKYRRKYTNIQKEIMEKQSTRPAATINLINTKYPILLEVASEHLNWKVENFSESKNWHIKWCDTGVTNELLQKMHYLQRINHFPAMSVIARKNTLALTLAKMRDQFPAEYDFYPRTFLYPNDQAKIRHYFVESRKRGLVKTFIVKPEAGCQGRGIYLTQNPADIQRQERCVVQKYISNPLLYKGLKFDLRIYVLIACINPLRIYLYNEGLVRFSTQPYEFPDIGNMQNFFMHLTNYAINKSNPNYQYNYSVSDMSHGHKKSLAQFFKILKDMGYKANSYWSQVKDQIIKTIIAAQPFILSNYKSSRPLQPTQNMCFQLLGFDFMIDNQDRCFLLQVNHTPSFTTDTPLDHIIKKNLIKDTLLMMSVSQEQANVREELERMKQREKYIKIKHGNDNNNERNDLVQMLNEIRETQEQCFHGTYDKIYPSNNPSKQQKYEQLLASATKLHQNSTSSTSSTNIRNRIQEVPRSKVVSKQTLTKIMQKPEPSNKKNIIYSYNNIKHNAPSSNKRTLQILQTLPSEPVRTESHPKKQFSSGKSSRAESKSKLKTEKSLTKEVFHPQSLRRIHKSEEKRYNPIIYEYQKPSKEFKSSYASQQKNRSSRQLSSFTKRIRSYKTPLMF